MKGKHFEISFEEMSGGTMVLFHEEVKLNLKVNVPVPENPGKTSDDETTDGPGIVHAHTKIYLPFSWGWGKYHHKVYISSESSPAQISMVQTKAAV